MTQLNNQTYLNWLDYITDKFPVDQFIINIEDFPEEKIDTITVTLKDGSSRTSLVFDIIDNDLCRECFYHPDTVLYNAENNRERNRSLMVSDYELSDENLSAMDDYLDIPLYYGYTERTVYIKGQLRRVDLLYAEQTIIKLYSFLTSLLLAHHSSLPTPSSPPPPYPHYLHYPYIYTPFHPGKYKHPEAFQTHPGKTPPAPDLYPPVSSPPIVVLSM